MSETLIISKRFHVNLVMKFSYIALTWTFFFSPHRRRSCRTLLAITGSMISLNVEEKSINYELNREKRRRHSKTMTTGPLSENKIFRPEKSLVMMCQRVIN